jgi:PAS domain S-box-containing protein
MSKDSKLTPSGTRASSNTSADRPTDLMAFGRAETLFRSQQQEVYREIDRLFVWLLLLEWAVAVVVALLVSPASWRGAHFHVGLHVWAALLFGGTITLLPCVLVRFWPGKVVTRYTIAAAQMLHSGLLISLSGGRLETHFHVYCSLVVLSFYRDWRVLVPATFVVVLDHFVGGIYWPCFLYGEANSNVWTSIEHCAWILFEDIFLAISCLRSCREMRATAHRTAALEASEQNFRQIFEEAPIGMAVLRMDERFQKANAAFCRMLDYSPEELTEYTPHELTHPEDRAATRKNSLTLLGSGGSHNLEKRFLRRNGEVVWAMRTGCVIRDEAGRPRQFLIMVEDITERKRVELALEEQSARLIATQHANQLIMDKSRDVICANDAEGRFVRVSASCEALWGYKPEELIGKSCVDFVHRGDRERSRLANFEIMAGHPVTNFENRYLRKDGTIVNVLWSAYWSEQDGTMFQVARDITERKRAEAALEKSNRQLASAHQANQLIMDNSQDVICSLDLHGRFLSVNAACRSLWGYEAEELIGRVYLALVHPEDRARSRQMEEEARADGKVSDFVNRCLRKDGTEVDVLWSASWSASDEILFCVAHDVTEQKRVERALREAKEAADRANRGKSEFLSRMSHELRTPLNAILGFGQLLERQNPRATQRGHLHHILTAGRHLLELINEVLDISRIESDRMHLSLEPVSVKIALEEAVELIRPLAAEHAVNLFTPTEGETDHFVFADHQRLKQVLLNILNNGVKYTPEGGAVMITCKSSDQKVRLDIHDTGVGIAADKLSRLFTPFDRLGAEQLGIEGTGLGLALSRRLMEAMQGEIGVEISPGRGTTFWIELERTESPLKTNEQEAVLHPGLPIGKQCTILYIEDNLSNLSLVEQMLSAEPGIHLITAMQGRIGLDLARQHSPDLILLDLQLPDMPGSDVLAKLQSESATRDKPIVVLTADTTAGHLQCLLDAGARDYITKPIDVSRFYRLMEEIADEKRELVFSLTK